LRESDSLALNPALDPVLLARVEDAGLNASAPTQQRWLDGWLVRFSPGKAKRARCINAVAAGRRPVADKLAECATLFGAHGLPLIVRISPFTLPADLDATLAAVGLRRFDDTRVMVVPDLSVAAAPDPGSRYEVRSIALEPFAHRIGAMRGSSLAKRQAHAQRLVNSPVPFSAFEVCDAQEVIACGQIAMEGDLVGLYDIFTVPEARGRGVAKLLCKHLLESARSLGAVHAYLQVESDNHAAVAAYASLGFSTAYTYHYRASDPSAT
jgi:ribosomal protein S18 acetylase RimI-like enzyme